MKINFKVLVAAAALTCFSAVASAQFKMDSNGRSISNAGGATVGKIESDGKTVSNANGATLGKVGSDGKTISNRNGATVLKVSGNAISNANGATIASMNDVTNSIKGAKAEPIYVALWWFVVKGNK